LFATERREQFVSIATSSQSVGAAFDRCAAQYGSKVLLTYAGQELSYAEAKWRSDQLAIYLLSQTLRTNEVVGISSYDMRLVLMSCLGVMKAGCAYVPLDPALPDRRLQAMMKTVNLRHCVTDDSFADRLARLMGPGGAVIRASDFFGLAGDRLDIRVPETHTAHVLFTSGSTGIPKGVPRTHAQVLHNVFRHRDLGVGPSDRVTLITKNGFFESVSNPYTAFLNGATLCGIALMREGIEEFARWIRRERISVYYSFPTIFRQLASVSPSRSDVQSIRLVYLGGEPVEPNDLKTCRAILRSDAQIAVGLNSTETGLTLLNLFSAHAVDAELDVSVGKPVDEVDVELRDEAGQITTGRLGELVIRSRHIFSGYIAADPESQSRIYEDSGAPGHFVFHTRDLAKVDEAGCYTLVGRGGEQIKLRGYRIELAEVERALRSLASVADACAVVLGDASKREDLDLAVFVVARQARALNAAAVREQLREILPDYMIPAFIVPIDRLPQTPNGKIDRQALASTTKRSLTQPDSGSAPSSELETSVAANWCDLLNVNEVFRESNFFDLGGNSIKALRHIAYLRARFERQIPIKLLFERPTLHAFCQGLSQDHSLK
jgi:acyl-coenzyme A synthetase/AMP-(fatty) acid ligase/aryl carrier-like protein